MDTTFGKWNGRSQYRAGSLMRVVKEISKYKLDLVRVQVRWDKGCTKPTGKYTFYNGMGNGMRIMNQVQFFCT
jgi:hypothetical protein